MITVLLQERKFFLKILKINMQKNEKQMLTNVENTGTINKLTAKKVISNSFFTEEGNFLEKNVKKLLTEKERFAIVNKSLQKRNSNCEDVKGPSVLQLAGSMNLDN